MAPRTAESVKKLRNNISASMQAQQAWVSSGSVKSSRDLRRRIAFLEEKYQEYVALDQELQSLDSAASCDDAIAVEETYLTLTAQLETLLDQLEPQVYERKEGGSEYHSCDGRNNYRDVKYPKLGMPEFHGKPEDWPSFFQRFNLMVKGLHPLTQFEYLLPCLKNGSDAGIKHLPVLEENYEVALQKLRRRFDNKMLNLRRYLHELFQLPVAIENNPESLRLLIDRTASNIRAIENQGHSRDKLSNELLSILVTTKLDIRTKELYETTLAKKLQDSDDSTTNSTTDSDTEDTFNFLIEFLESRLHVVSAVFTNEAKSQSSSTKSSKSKAPSAPHKPQSLVTSASLTTSNNTPNNTAHITSGGGSSAQSSTPVSRPCTLCDKPHALYVCAEFKKLSVADRYEHVRAQKLCVNCFARGHWSNRCNSIKCKECGHSHHTLLHPPYASAPSKVPSTTPPTSATVSTASPSSAPATTIITTAIARQPTTGVLLATALVNAGINGQVQQATVLLDGGSHVSLITTQLAQRLNLPLESSTITISGVGGLPSTALARTSLQLTSLDSKFVLKADPFVVQRITEPLPPVRFNVNLNWTFLSKYQLADPQFHESKEIDILLGADLLYEILLPEFHRQTNAPTLQATRFGWVLSGPYSTWSSENQARCHLITSISTSPSDLTKFWELEDPPSITNKELSVQDEMCEQLFQDTYTRIDGRFCVRLPIFNPHLGESYNIARQRIAKTKITDEYRKFMEEYEELGHMTRVPDEEMGKAKYYIPHHAIYKNGKIRVVFNASSPTSNGVSLNDAAPPSPILQAKVFFVLLRFRTHLFVFTTDVVKMYRQIWVYLHDRAWQHILWKVAGRIIEFMLNTLTYGFRPSAFLALRCMLQLAIDGAKSHPVAAAAIQNGSYMDDLEDGADDIDAAISHRNELVDLLASAGMKLDKWQANDGRLLPHPKSSDEIDEPANTLGLVWHTTRDDLGVRQPEIVTKCTKRSVSSQLASIFDPLGFLSPITVTGKLILQSIWALDVDWDTPLPPEIEFRFKQFTNDLPMATDLRIPRHIYTAPPYTVEVHGFADASEQAYAACIYTRVVSSRGDIITRLVCSKTRLAPVRTPRTIPELELCAASLLVQLLKPVADHLQCDLSRCTLYSDSTIVLSYLSKEPHTWKVFVANRVRDILAIFPRSQWRHVAGLQNPVDLATRSGSFTTFQSRQDLWLNGPDFLKLTHNLEEFAEFDNEALSSARVAVNLVTESTLSSTRISNNIVTHLLARCSEYTRVQRLIVGLLRIKDFLLAKVQKVPPPVGEFSVAEFQRAERIILQEVQQTTFEQEFNCILANKQLPRKSKLKGLKPFLHNGLLHVGGRIARADLPFHSRHPIILPVNNRLTLLWTRHYHYQYYHAGPQFLEDFIRRRLWPIGNLTTLIRKCVNTCARCARFRRNPPIPPAMADLPESRVRPAAPFSQVGVDYAGPFIRKPEIRTRSATQLKTYVAVFVCFVVKAVHLEPVNDLTTDAFLAALRRFVSRRGLPHTIYSDNGTNFVGASRKLHESFNALVHTTPIQNFATAQQIIWKFNPPAAPHMGGLWEAAVKTMKAHLSRTIGTTLLTADEFITVLCQIEAIMNSRPLPPLSPGIPDALTPGHFLIGRPLVSLPEDSGAPLSLTARWALVNQLLQGFWRRWSTEYLQLLQKRVRWTTQGYDFKVGDVVLLKDELQPPLNWPLGLITQVYPGKDSIVRVVDVRCRGSLIFRRPVTKLVPLVAEDTIAISTTQQP